jgi:hypothetical protein
MTVLLIVFWTLVIFLSIFWYATLLFYVGVKGGKEIKELTERLGAREDLEKKP